MSIKKILDDMDYGFAPENPEEVKNWLLKHNSSFGHFIGGAFTKPKNHFKSINPSNGETIAHLSQASSTDVNNAVKIAKKTFRNWSETNPHERSKVLYSIARLLQKNSRLFSVLETIDNGKPIRESRDIDIPLAQRHFYYHAGLSQIYRTKIHDMEPIGVCGQIIPWNFPLLMLAWKIAPALAAGNTVVLKPAEYTSLTALLFAEICIEAGVPNGVVNIITGDGSVGEMLVDHPDIKKIAFTGSTEVGRIIRKRTAGTGKLLTLELGGKSPFIVFDDADLDSAVEGLVDAIWFNQGQVCCAGSRLLVHESIEEKFHKKIRNRMNKLRVGAPLDKSIDMGAIVDKSQLSKIRKLVSQTEGSVYQAECDLPKKGLYYLPTLITGLSTSDKLMQEEIFGPVLVSTTFRTPKEASDLANDTTYGLAASIWSENINLALGIAPKIKAGVIWVNGTNMFDAAIGFGGVKESGFGREGGWNGLKSYLKHSINFTVQKNKRPENYSSQETLGLDRTAKLYIGGKQTRPDGGYSQKVFDASKNFAGHIPASNRKDIRNAVEAMNKASNWSTSSGHLRAQIIYFMAENLHARREEFAKRINQMSGHKDGAKEVEMSIRRLFTYAAWADKFDGTISGVPVRGVGLTMREAIGNIIAFCPPNKPLLSLISCIAPAIAMGNRITTISPFSASITATDFYQILETSDIPPGVVNILTGSHLELASHAASHMDVDSVWSFSEEDITKIIELESANNIKRTWCLKNIDWLDKRAEGDMFLDAATETKSVWIPYGEG
ncbi:MAG: aldehyde dehydrogenase family protein [Paracoccaceae bacterium]